MSRSSRSTWAGATLGTELHTSTPSAVVFSHTWTPIVPIEHDGKKKQEMTWGTGTKVDDRSLVTCALWRSGRCIYLELFQSERQEHSFRPAPLSSFFLDLQHPCRRSSGLQYDCNRIKRLCVHFGTAGRGATGIRCRVAGLLVSSLWHHLPPSRSRCDLPTHRTRMAF